MWYILINNKPFSHGLIVSKFSYVDVCTLYKPGLLSSGQCCGRPLLSEATGRLAASFFGLNGLQGQRAGCILRRVIILFKISPWEYRQEGMIKYWLNKLQEYFKPVLSFRGWGQSWIEEIRIIRRLKKLVYGDHFAFCLIIENNSKISH